MSTPFAAVELIEESVGAAAVLRLNRPARRNALTAELVDQNFGEALQAVRDKRAPVYPPRSATDRTPRTGVAAS